MTLPSEEKWALINTKAFLRKLLNPKETPRIPRYIRDEAYRCLKHFPFEHRIDTYFYEDSDGV